MIVLCYLIIFYFVMFKTEHITTYKTFIVFCFVAPSCADACPVRPGGRGELQMEGGDVDGNREE